MARIIKIDELISNIDNMEPGKTTEYGNITIKCEPDNRHTLTLGNGRETVEGVLSYWPNRPNGNTYEWDAYKNGNDIRGGCNDPHVAWKSLIADMRELYDRH